MGVVVDVTKGVGTKLITELLNLLKRPLGYVTSQWMLRVTSRVSRTVLAQIKDNNGVKILDIPSIGGHFKVASKVERGTLIFDFPNSYKETFVEKGFKDNSYQVKIDNAKALKSLKKIIEELMPDADADKEINLAIAAVAEKFHRDLCRGCQRTNNLMYGVQGIDCCMESKSYVLRLFKTDYFSFKVIVKIYEKLVATGTDFFRITQFSDFERVFPFMACFGVGGVLNLKLHGVEGVIVGQRSKSVACPEAWHLSFDETYDPRDKDPLKIGGEYPDVKICMKRGLIEELGINIQNIKHNVDKSCFVVIMNENRFEAGLFAYVDLFLRNKKELYRAVASVAFASDVDNEYEQVQIIPKEEVRLILFNPKNKTTPEAPIIWSTFEAVDEERGFFTRLLFKIDNWLHK